MEQADADIMCFEYTHKPYCRIMNSANETQNHYRHAINIGSVGKPKDGNPQGGYVLLHIHKNSKKLYADSLQVQFIRFDCDI